MGLVVRPLGAQINVMGSGLYQPPRTEIAGITPDTWYSPLQPVRPIAPEGTEPRAFQYWAGQNLLWTPRPDATYSAAQLKQLATYPLASICISNIKDVICKAPWEIQVKLQPGETRREAARRSKGDKNIIKLQRFFEKPDREHAWDEWLRPLLDDMLVIDASTILVRKTFAGEIAELCVLRGESITRYIDVNGWTPRPPFPAYAQNWWGIPLVNLTTDQLIYKPRNLVPRNTISSQLYGMSPTEQLAPEIEIGQQRLEFVKAYYTEGSVPGLLQVVPRGTSVEKISEAMGWMNSELAGNLAARRQIRLIQGWNEPGKADQIVMTKEPLLADNYDELLTKRIAYGYGASPQRLIKQMNRASAQQADEAAELEGSMPYFVWLKQSIMDYIIQHVFNMTDYEWVPDPFREPSFDRAAEAVSKIMSKPVMDINEVRDRLGLEPRPEPEASELGMATANGWLPLKDAIEIARITAAGAGNATKQPTKTSSKPDGKDSSSSKVNGGAESLPPGRVNGAANKLESPQASVLGFAGGATTEIRRGKIESNPDLMERMAKAIGHPVINPGKSLPQTIKARHFMERLLKTQFKVMERKATKVILNSLTKAGDDPNKKILAELNAALAAHWQEVAFKSESAYESAAEAGVTQGAASLEAEDSAVEAATKKAAVAAQERAAELVGLKWHGEELVPDSKAEHTITETTEETISEILAELPESPSLNQVVEALDKSGAFSDARAENIAKQEMRTMQAAANLIFWKESGGVHLVDWVLSPAHDDDDLCDALAADGPYHIDQVPDFPAHPNCLCRLQVRTLVGEEDL